jgi:hypothetical protein
MATKKDHASRMTALTAKIESPSVVGEIDKVLRDMRHEWLDMIGLRNSAVRRHGERGGSPLPPVLPPEYEARDNAPAAALDAEPKEQAPKMTIAMLMEQYTSDQDSLYQKLNFSSRKHYDTMMELIRREHRDVRLAEITGRMLQQWHVTWSEGGKVTIAHSKMGMLRRMFSFGVLVLGDEECTRLATVLRSLRIKAPKKRTERLSPEQAVAIRAKAHENERPSIALAQAFQFDFGLMQKEVIGEWVPMSEDFESDVIRDFNDGTREKWVRGLLWEHIGNDLVLRIPQQTFPDGRVLNLRLAPMILEELAKRFGFDHQLIDRKLLPESGPVIVSEYDDLPWSAVEFRRWWRRLADACNVPKNIRNSDSRPKVGRRYPDQDAGDDDFASEDDPDIEQELSLH